LWQEKHAHGKRLLSRQRNRSLFEEKSARNCGEYPDAVAAFAIRSYRTAMRQAAQRRQCETQDVMIGRAVQRRNKSDAARLMIKAGAKKVSTEGAN
jgi:hypothetical protein